MIKGKLTRRIAQESSVAVEDWLPIVDVIETEENGHRNTEHDNPQADQVTKLLEDEVAPQWF